MPENFTNSFIKSHHNEFKMETGTFSIDNSLKESHGKVRTPQLEKALLNIIEEDPKACTK